MGLVRNPNRFQCTFYNKRDNILMTFFNMWLTYVVLYPEKILLMHVL